MREPFGKLNRTSKEAVFNPKFMRGYKMAAQADGELKKLVSDLVALMAQNDTTKEDAKRMDELKRGVAQEYARWKVDTVR